MKIWSLAARNLLRNRRRSIATLLALAIGSASILIFGGYSTSIRYSMLTAYVRTGGHLQIQHRDFFLYGNGNPTAYGMADYNRLITSIQKDERLSAVVSVATPVLQFGGIAGNYDAGVSRTVVGMGYVANDISRMRQWNEYDIPLEPPPFALENAAPDSAIVGTGVARVLLLCEPLGVPDCPRPEREEKGPSRPMAADLSALVNAEAANTKTVATAPGRARIELLAGNSRGTPNVAALNIVAAEGQGFKELDEVAVILHLKQAQQLVYGRAAPRATALMVQLKETRQIKRAVAQIKELIARSSMPQPLAVLDFEELNPFYVQTIQLFDMIFGFIFALIGAIVLFTVSNTMNAAVVERTVEIGTLRAMGHRQSGIRRIFVTEGFLLGCAGALIGMLSALLMSGIVNHLNLTWVPPGSSEPLPLTVRIWGETRMLFGTTLGLIAIGTASAWWPAWRAAKLKIVEALRHA